MCVSHVCACMHVCQLKCMCVHAYGHQEITWNVIPQVLPPPFFIGPLAWSSTRKVGYLASPRIQLSPPPQC